MRFAPLLTRQGDLALFIHRTCRPLARQELAHWERQARAIADPHLRDQALGSLSRKAFHCEGASVYAAGTPDGALPLVRVIVAFQTLVDYLDNLSDRCDHVCEATLRQLHCAVDDALNPSAPPQRYTDGCNAAYLAALVSCSQANLLGFPGYASVADHCRYLGSLYSQLQVLKHLPDRLEREERLISWLEPMLANYPGWRWWELAAACGSTLAIFALLAAAASPERTDIDRLLQAYFPWVCGLHILLDYYIDQAEDRANGDLNFFTYYPTATEAAESLQRIQMEAHRQVRTLRNRALHSMIAQGLLGLYLSDPKVVRQGFGPTARLLLRTGGPLSVGAYWYCRLSPPGR